MQTSPIQVNRTNIRFEADDRRVIPRFFGVGGEDRQQRVVDRVMSMPEADVAEDLRRVEDDFNNRHKDIHAYFRQHFDHVQRFVPDPDTISEERKLLIGVYFTMEYAIESAALFNPSIVPHYDQANLAPGQMRFLMSLRATGEGHVSSIVFRSGTVDMQGHVEFAPPSRLVAPMQQKIDRAFQKKLFFSKLIEMGAYTEDTRIILDELPETFDYPQIETVTRAVESRHSTPSMGETANNIRWLARSNYELLIPHESAPDEIVIFPTSENESRGIEDARLTRFVDDDGSVTYYGTYTAYNGFNILPQMFETTDFDTVRVHTLNGKHVQNKGMALFPRKLNGFYYMVSRLDGENMFIMKSDNPYFWNQAERLQAPMYPWEYIQIGNCGPPIETEHGWLLLTHGVGPVRTYCIGASLLDLENPSRVIGHLEKPLIVPEEHERDGYVPNVVYTCGAMRYNNHLVIPYAVSDSATTCATVNMTELMDVLLNSTKSCPLPDRRVTQRV
ncbi:MAG: glycoside hydrolase family 130 protein [Planctomycetota bacterium]